MQQNVRRQRGNQNKDKSQCESALWNGIINPTLMSRRFPSTVLYRLTLTNLVDAAHNRGWSWKAWRVIQSQRGSCECLPLAIVEMLVSF